MKHLVFLIWSIIITIVWFIIMIPSFIIRILWDLNVKHYKFKYNGYDTYHKWDIPAFLGCVRPIYFKEDYDFKSYFHYVWNIKSE